MRYSTEEGDDIDVYVTAGEISDDSDEPVEFDQLTVSIRKNGVEGRSEAPPTTRRSRI